MILFASVEFLHLLKVVHVRIRILFLNKYIYIFKSFCIRFYSVNWLVFGSWWVWTRCNISDHITKYPTCDSSDIVHKPSRYHTILFLQVRNKLQHRWRLKRGVPWIPLSISTTRTFHHFFTFKWFWNDFSIHCPRSGWKHRLGLWARVSCWIASRDELITMNQRL